MSALEDAAVDRARLRLLGHKAMSTRRMAALVGLHHSHVARVLTGERGLTAKAMKAWSKALGVTLDEMDDRLFQLQRALAGRRATKGRKRARTRG